MKSFAERFVEIREKWRIYRQGTSFASDQSKSRNTRVPTVALTQVQATPQFETAPITSSPPFKTCAGKKKLNQQK